MEEFQKQQQISDETQEPNPQANSTSSKRLLRPENSTLLKSEQISRSQSPIVLPGFIDQKLAAQLSKNTGRRVTIAPQPSRKPPRRREWIKVLYFQQTDHVNSPEIANEDAKTLRIRTEM